MRKISQDQLRRDIFKPLAEHELLSKAQFEKAFPASKFERYNISGLNKARLAVFEKCKANPDQQEDIIQKANIDFNSLKRVNVMLSTPEGKNFETVFFVRALEKGMQGEEINLTKDESKKKKSDPDNDGDDDSVGSKKNPDENEDVDNTDKNSGQENDEKEETENESETDKDEEEETDEVSEEAMEVLAFIKETLDADGKVNEKEISEEEGLSDDETNALIEELVQKGYIDAEEDENGRGYNITGITEEGLAAMGNEDSEADAGATDEDNQAGDDQNSADVQGDKIVMDKKEFIDEHKKLVDKLDQSGNKEEAADQKEELNGVQAEDKQENGADANADTDNQGEDQTGSGDQSKQQTDVEDQTGDGKDDQSQQGDSGHKPTPDEKQGAAQAGQQGGMDTNQLADFAKQTPTDKLKEYVADQSNPPANIQVAQAELDRREKEGDAGPGAQGMGQEETPEEKAEKDEFDGWLGDYFDNHDIEDLQELTKSLILASPSETKILKDHYRNDFKGQNKGNQALKVDKKEFEEWLSQYLEHYPQAHLKEYATKLASKDPDALNKLKGKYKALKDNKIV